MGQVSNGKPVVGKRISAIARAVTDAVRQVRRGDMPILASSLAFGTVLSLVPLLAVSLSVFKAFGGLEKMFDGIERLLLQEFAGGSGGTEVRRALRSSIERVHSGALGVGGVAGLLYTSTKLFSNMDTAVHRMWGMDRARPLWRSLLLYWMLMFAGPIALAAALGLIGSFDVDLYRTLPRETIAVAVAWGAFFALCKWVPSRAVQLRPAFWSACAGAFAFFVVQEFYSYLTRQILNYNKVYGSLAAIPIFLLWILILWQVSLATVALCASWQLRLDAEAEAGSAGAERP